MEDEKEVCSLELAKKLNELGFKQESLFYWKASWHDNDDRFYYNLVYSEDIDFLESADFRAYTVAELGRHIPDTIEVKHNFLDETLHIQIENNFKRISYRNIELGKTRFSFEEKNEADTRAKVICYLKENNLI